MEIKGKEIKCVFCGNKWYVNSDELDDIKSCPFCSDSLRRPGARIEKIDTLEKALYMVFLDKGFYVLNNFTVISIYLEKYIEILDYETKRYINILKEIGVHQTMFYEEDNLIDCSRKLNNIFSKNEEYQYETDKLCDIFLRAIKYYKNGVLMVEEKPVTFIDNSIKPEDLEIKIPSFLKNRRYL